MLGLLRKIVGSKNEREIRRLQPMVARVNELEPALQALPDDRLAAKTVEFRERVARGEPLERLMPEAFATVREASRRVLGMRHFDVQLIGGAVLHEGKIAEMKTGEGKTLVATLPVYLNALAGKGVHVVTVNDYLARRDSEWMGRIYRFLGLTVGIIVHGLTDAQRKASYAADVTYGTNNEFGFDYLRDNMKWGLDQYVQRDLHYAIVDEVDSILIDEARTPLIISGPTEQSTEKYYVIDRLIPTLKKDEDYTIEEKTKSVMLTEEGIAKAERFLGVDNLYDPRHIETLHHVNQALKAHTLFRRDVEYVVKDGEVIIVDEFTGRLMPGRRWSDGLHQAIEAKEGVKIANENQTLATITFQNYFRMYEKLAGMTGTAETEAAEFAKIYDLDVVVIPTNMPMIRKDNSDLVYKTAREKYKAVVEEIKALHKTGRPVLVGTISIEKSELLSGLLKRQGIPHNVLNAKHHEREAEIVAQAGKKGAVTISTNMAGRGTDILLGGNPEFLAKEALRKEGLDPAEAPKELFQQKLAEIKRQTDAEHEEVVKLGGLHIIGTERHESRRIDNQLRGRAGRQGDPGSSQFYLSLEDDLLRIFGSDRIKSIMGRLGLEEDQPIEHSLLTRAIENAQKKVEAHNFEIRKHLLEYDDVMNKQREVIYGRRREILAAEDIKEDVLEIVEELAERLAEQFAEDDRLPESWDLGAFKEAFEKQFGRAPELPEDPGELTRAALVERAREAAVAAYEAKERELTPPIMRFLERQVFLSVIDTLWKDHLLNMDQLKEGIGLRGYGQRDPLREYQREAYDLFEEMFETIKLDTVERLMHVQIAREEPAPVSVRRAEPAAARAPAAVPAADGGRPLAPSAAMRRSAPLAPPNGGAGALVYNRNDGPAEPARRDVKKVGRNDPCPCGSGKKYKKCHGQ
ncbi:MAG TPA: preprotein translocase subunit SecA [Thermodesulfobacteriota bacterium]